jgi:Calcineurin-like phosphoesterase
MDTPTCSSDRDLARQLAQVERMRATVGDWRRPQALLSFRMRALVISDTHFGAWTGEDLLREQANLDLLEPHLDVDEVIVLGDMFDFLFGSLTSAYEAATGLLDLLREKLQGKRLVCLAGNHDHHVVTTEGEARLELQLAGRSPRRGDREALEFDPLYRLFEQRLEGVEVDFCNPTYTFGGVLCTHGHYLDVHAQRAGSGMDRLLGQVIWKIAVGSRHSPTLDDYEATTTLLTELLFTIAQVPNGTNTERSVYKSFETLGRAARRATAPRRALEALAEAVKEKFGPVVSGTDRPSAGATKTYEGARSHEVVRRRRTGAPAGGEASSFLFARRIHPSDPTEAAVAAFDQVVTNLGWADHANTIVFAHTHQPLDGVLGPSGQCRYWNTGSWIYEPDLSSRRAYMAYLHNAWPGTAVLIDTDQDQPQLLRLREHLNPLNAMDGDRSEGNP